MHPERRPAHPYASRRFAAIAHRGGSLLPGNEGRENTVHAFRAAVALGYDVLETDVHATRDGVLVVFHDLDTERLTGVAGSIEARTLAQVEELRVGGEPVPTLDEALETFPDQAFNIDLKGPRTAAPLARLVARHRAQSRVAVASFSPGRLARFRRLTQGTVATSVSARGILWNRFAPRPLLRLLNSPGVALQIPVAHPLGPLPLTVFRPRLVANAHAAGKLVHVWTIDDAAEMRRLVTAGVDGLITDRPDVLKQVLKDLDLWEGTP